MANGSVEPLKMLHDLWGDRIQFLEVLVHQEHPGPDAPAYNSIEQKMRDAQRYKRIEQIPWPVLVDDLEGTVHQVYGGLAKPTYLIDANGRVAFYNLWSYAPGLHLAIQELLAQGERGIVRGGIDRIPHLATAFVHGWKGLARGLPQSFTDLLVALPGVGPALWVGYQMRPVLEPWIIRARPLPNSVRAAFLAGVVALAFLLLRGRRKDRFAKRHRAAETKKVERERVI